MIANTLEQLGRKRYSTFFVHKEGKKLEKTGVAVAAGGGGVEEGTNGKKKKGR